MYVSPIRNAESLIFDGPVLGDRPESLLVSDRLSDIDGSWEAPVISGYMAEERFKRRNASDLLARMRSHISSPGRLLDIGCFCGLFLDEARRAGWTCEGLEPLPMPAIYARGQFGLSVKTDTLREDSFTPAAFDAVTILQVLEHIPDPGMYVRMARRFLRPGGILVVEVPSLSDWSARVFGSRHRHFVSDHLNFFTGRTLGALLEQNGFRTVGAYYPARWLSGRFLLYWTRKMLGVHGRGASWQFGCAQWFASCGVKVTLRDIVAVFAVRED